MVTFSQRFTVYKAPSSTSSASLITLILSGCPPPVTDEETETRGVLSGHRATKEGARTDSAFSTPPHVSLSSPKYFPHLSAETPFSRKGLRRQPNSALSSQMVVNAEAPSPLEGSEEEYSISKCLSPALKSPSQPRSRIE